MSARVQPSSPHDACGVGFIAQVHGRADHEIVALGLKALRRLTHRGAPATLGAVDGCGLLTAIPWEWLADTLGSRMPVARSRALGMLFVHSADRELAAAIIDRELRDAGAKTVEWRVVPTERGAVLRAQRQSTPVVLQVVAGFEDARTAVETALYRARLRIERLVRREGVRATIASLSTRTVVYKALVAPDALDRFYPDLAETRFASSFVTFHQRFSTNTSADWALTQPFRTLAHSGEINTIAGNRLWMRARTADPAAIGGFDLDPPIAADGSDSRSLDDAIELLRHHGYSLSHAVARLVPPAWERDRDLPPDVRAFYEFQSLLSEPWDGPSALVFADGRYVGAALDRNGFRSVRVVTTASGLIAAASEVGILPADEHEIVNRDRLGPGDMILVDVERGTVLGTCEVRRRLAFRHRYRILVGDVVRSLAADLNGAALNDAATSLSILDDPATAKASPHTTAPGPNVGRAELSRRQTAFGCTGEELDLIVKPMMADGYEAVGAMGDVAPPAVWSARPRLLTDFFRQRFAQVTTPPVDPFREASVMSLTTMIGGHGSFLDELAPRPPRIVLRSPILARRELAQLLASTALAPATIDLVFTASAGPGGLDDRLTAIAGDACAAVRAGSALVVLSDRGVDADRAMVPALLATAAVHHALVAAGLRMRASIVVETGDARDAHQLGVLFGYGAAAVCPSLGYDSVAAMADADPTGCNVALTRYRLALERGLQTLMSKMGVCTFSGYCGAQLFEAFGLDGDFVDRFFPGTASPVGGITLPDVAAAVLDRHRRAFGEAQPASEYPGLHTYHPDGEYHATNPMIVRGLQTARDQGAPAYETFQSHVYNRPPTVIRDLLEIVAPASTTPSPLGAVEPVEDICRRFFASMSVGALSPEARRTIAVAMNRLGARSSGGEDGEEQGRYVRGDGRDSPDSRTKQVASARFGVTPAYLRSADELQIKIAQGSKPGEGGHHDIYGIEDLAQLIFDLRTFHPAARISVKLAASVGAGIIAAGVAKAGADAIQISGHDGGTGASSRASIKHAGMPWEIGLSDAHQALMQAGLRGRVVLQTDRGLKTGRDIAIAAALGAQEYGFGTAALVAIGCAMARECHANTRPAGIATQRDDLRADFAGTADMWVGYLKLIAAEVREILAALGLTRLDDLVGRTDLLQRRAGLAPAVDLAGLLGGAEVATRDAVRVTESTARLRATNQPAIGAELLETISAQFPLTVSGPITNTDRAFGVGIAGEIAARFGDAGLPDGSVQLSMTGSAGQSAGAFMVPGMRLALVGDANDGLGKSMHGGEIVVAPPARERGRANQVLVGNAALYGATGGRLFVAGSAGERFAVRNSGATAVVEGVGDHACEYMSGGFIVVLGKVGLNFAAGMTGGVVYVGNGRETLASRTHPQQLEIDTPTLAEQKVLRELLETHERLTGSRVARALLRHDRNLAGFCRVTPIHRVAVAVTPRVEVESVAQAV